MAQPTFIFGEQSGSGHYANYTLGVVLSTILSFITGVAPIVQSKCREIPISYFMLWSGLAKLVIGLLCPLFGVMNHLGDMTKLQQDAPTLTLVSGASMMGAMFTQLAVSVSNEPILVSVTRSMEIVMALFLDTVIAPPEGGPPIDYGSLSFGYKILGSLIVFFCVCGIAVHDSVMANGASFVKRVFRIICPSRSDYSPFDELEATEEVIVDNEDESLLNSRRNGYGSTQNHDQI